MVHYFILDRNNSVPSLNWSYTLSRNLGRIKAFRTKHIFSGLSQEEKKCTTKTRWTNMNTTLLMYGLSESETEFMMFLYFDAKHYFINVSFLCQNFRKWAFKQFYETFFNDQFGRIILATVYEEYFWAIWAIKCCSLLRLLYIRIWHWAFVWKFNVSSFFHNCITVFGLLLFSPKRGKISIISTALCFFTLFIITLNSKIGRYYVLLKVLIVF